MRYTGISPAPSPLTAWLSPTPAFAPSPSLGVSDPLSSHSSNHDTFYFSPPLIAMVVVLAVAFLFVTYSRLISRRCISPLFLRFRRWRCRRRRQRRLLHLSSSATSSSSDLRYSLSTFPLDSFHYLSDSPYGLDDSVIKTLPLFMYSVGKSNSTGKSAAGGCRDCAVCLLEFEEGDYIRRLPLCSHAFHLDCIDEWLRSHPNCPLCRAAILGSAAAVLAPPSPFVPLMASRIRPSLDEEVDAIIIRSISGAPPTENAATADQEIAQAVEDQSPGIPTRFPQLKRSYSFEFERESMSERIATDQPATSPWRYRRSAGSIWNKRSSPFGNLISKHRVVSFRCHRFSKSPFFRRRAGTFFPISERIPSAGSSSRRMKAMSSPVMLFRTAPQASSRLRCGDPEALLSPERWQRGV